MAGWFDNSHFAFCRGLANHAWKYPPRLEYDGRELVVTLSCANCTSSRKDRVSAGTGHVLKRHYIYADGYLLDLGGEKSPPKDDLRRDATQLMLKEFKIRPLAAVKPKRKSSAA